MNERGITAPTQGKTMDKLKHDLLTSKYTEVWKETDEKMRFNAPHLFIVSKTEDAEIIGEIHFQEGPIKENGVNGVCNEDLIAMVICRLEYFQKTQYACRENAVAITKLEEALMWLRKRTIRREISNVEGTSKE